VINNLILLKPYIAIQSVYIISRIAAPKLSSKFQGKCRAISTLKIEFILNVVTIFEISAKIEILKMFDKNINIGANSICNFSTNFLGGRKIAQGAGNILPKVSPKVARYVDTR